MLLFLYRSAIYRITTKVVVLFAKSVSIIISLPQRQAILYMRKSAASNDTPRSQTEKFYIHCIYSLHMSASESDNNLYSYSYLSLISFDFALSLLQFDWRKKRAPNCNRGDHYWALTVELIWQTGGWRKSG